MVAKNSITGDKIQTKVPSQQYKDNYDAIFRSHKDKFNATHKELAGCQHSEQPQDND